MKYYTVLALLPCIPFSWALSLFLLDHGALILGVGKVAKIVALPCLWAYLALTKLDCRRRRRRRRRRWRRERGEERASERAGERRGEEDEEWRSAFVPRERHLGIGLDKDNTHAWHKDYRVRLGMKPDSRCQSRSFRQC